MLSVVRRRKGSAVASEKGDIATGNMKTNHRHSTLVKILLKPGSAERKQIETLFYDR